MPLSEHEQRQLEEIERALYSEDPKFAHAVRFRDPRVHYRRRALQGLAGFVVGVALLLAGVISRHMWIGVAGVVVMLGGGMWALASWRHLASMTPARAPRARTVHRRRGPVGRPSFMERLEERWRRRQEEGS